LRLPWIATNPGQIFYLELISRTPLPGLLSSEPNAYSQWLHLDGRPQEIKAPAVGYGGR
jgi:hypothetical protein